MCDLLDSLSSNKRIFVSETVTLHAGYCERRVPDYSVSAIDRLRCMSVR